METNIKIEEIKKYSKIYNDDPQNKKIEKLIATNGIDKTCINKEIIKENKSIFNIELSEGKIRDQGKSNRCWIYAGLNTIEYNIADNLNIDVKELELSNNYISFFDKLERSNNTYENIIRLEKNDFEYINKEKILKYCVSAGGYWRWVVSIINKYGIVPQNAMPDVKESMDFEKVETLYLEKVRKDVIKIINMKKENKNIDEIRKYKNECLQENYNFLSKILGEPKLEFNYEYKDKNNRIIELENITPLEFKNRYLTINLDDFISIGNLPMYNKEFYKCYRKKYFGNIFEQSYVEFLNLPINELKELVIEQLKDGMPVYFGGNINLYECVEYGILDTRIYDYKKILNLNNLTKEEALNINSIGCNHAMVFKGVREENNKPYIWKVEDSHGDRKRYNGYYIMNDNFFNEYVLEVIIDKKHLTDKQKEALKQEPILFDIEQSY